MLEVVSIFVLVFSVLQIILFFKVWGMTSNVSKIKDSLSILGNADDKSNWKREFCVLVASGNKEEAKKLLLREMINTLSFRNIVVSENASYREKELNSLNEKYSAYLKTVGLSLSDIDFSSSIYKESLK